MALSKERLGEIALLALQAKVEKDGGVRLNPKEIKREVANSAKQLNVPFRELAELFEVVIKASYVKTMAQLDKLKNDVLVKVD